MNSRSLLGLSVIANILLVGVVGYLLKERPRQLERDAAAQPAITNVAPVVPKPATRTITVTNQLEHKFDWRAVESADYKEYIANLRSIGCPEETIRDIIVADVNKLFESRRKALGSGKKFEFWKTGNMFAAMVDEEAIQKKAELAKEKKALIKELLGIEIEEPTDLAAITNPLTTMLDFLPDDKQAKVSELMQSHQTKMMKSIGSGTPDAEDMKALMKVQKEFDAELAKILSPQEFEDYQLRLSQTSMMMRMQLGTFDPSEQEFRDIFKLRKAFDDEFGYFGIGASSQEERDRRSAAEKETKDQIKSLLGDARYEEYERAQDWKFQNLAKIAERNGLQQDAAIQVYEMDKIARDEMSRLRLDNSLDADKREELIKAIKEETHNSIRDVLGEKAFESYTNGPGRHW